jgi:hypothetical membrane protein
MKPKSITSAYFNKSSLIHYLEVLQRMDTWSARIAGTLLFLGGVQFVIVMVIAEAMYPGYSVSRNFISDLGVGPVGMLFNFSVSLLGLSAVLGAYFAQRTFRQPVLTALFGIAGAGTIGVGVFPETVPQIHLFVSFVTFLFGGLSAIAAYSIERRPINLLSILMGVLSLVALSLFAIGLYLGLGPGGMERMIAYPILLWLIGFGAQLMGGLAPD